MKITRSPEALLGAPSSAPPGCGNSLDINCVANGSVASWGAVGNCRLASPFAVGSGQLCETDEECLSGSCDEGYCHSWSGPFGACLSNADCPSGRICSPAATCELPAVENSTCSADALCPQCLGPGLYCKTDIDSGTCQRAKVAGPGDTCDGVSALTAAFIFPSSLSSARAGHAPFALCREGLICGPRLQPGAGEGNVCQHPPTLGQACSPAVPCTVHANATLACVAPQGSSGNGTCVEFGGKDVPRNRPFLLSLDSYGQLRVTADSYRSSCRGSSADSIMDQRNSLFYSLAAEVCPSDAPNFVQSSAVSIASAALSVSCISTASLGKACDVRDTPPPGYRCACTPQQNGPSTAGRLTVSHPVDGGMSAEFNLLPLVPKPSHFQAQFGTPCMSPLETPCLLEHLTDAAYCRLMSRSHAMKLVWPVPGIAPLSSLGLSATAEQAVLDTVQPLNHYDTCIKWYRDACAMRTSFDTKYKCAGIERKGQNQAPRLLARGTGKSTGTITATAGAVAAVASTASSASSATSTAASAQAATGATGATTSSSGAGGGGTAVTSHSSVGRGGGKGGASLASTSILITYLQGVSLLMTNGASFPKEVRAMGRSVGWMNFQVDIGVGFGRRPQTSPASAAASMPSRTAGLASAQEGVSGPHVMSAAAADEAEEEEDTLVVSSDQTLPSVVVVLAIVTVVVSLGSWAGVKGMVAASHRYERVGQEVERRWSTLDMLPLTATLRTLLLAYKSVATSTWRLLIHPAVEVQTSSVASGVVLGIFVLLSFVITVPLAVHQLTVNPIWIRGHIPYMDRRRKDVVVPALRSVLVAAYTDDRYWWATVKICRHAASSLALGAFFRDPVAQGVVLLLVSAAYFAGLWYVRPYRASYDDRMEMAAEASEVVQVLLMVLLAADPTSATLAGTTVAVHLMCSLALAGATLQQPARSFWSRYCAHRVPESWREPACCSICPPVARRGWYRAVESAREGDKAAEGLTSEQEKLRGEATEGDEPTADYAAF